MKNKKVSIFIVLLIIGIIVINAADKKLRYEIGLLDYYKYNSPLTEKENKMIREKDNFLVGIYNYPPLTYTNEFNNYNTGIAVDYLSQLAIEIGSNIHLKAGKIDHLADAQQRGEIDVIVVENIRDEKDEKIDDALKVTQPLCVVKSKILVKKDSRIETITDFDNKTLVTLQKYNIDNRINKFFSGINVKIIEVDNIYQCFALLSNNDVSGLVGDDMEAAHFLNVTNKSSNYKFLRPTLYEKEISLAVKNENDDLLNVLNKGIMQLKKKNLIVQTQYKWLGNFDTDGIDLKTIELAYKILIVGLFIIGSFSTWNYVITQKVNVRTRELFESKEELRLIIDTMRSGIMVIDNNSLILECNNAIAELMNITKENLIGFHCNDITALEPFVDKDNMNTVLNIGNSYYYVTSQKVTNNKGMIVIEDYTEKYLKEKRERQESKMIAVGQLSAGLAHEIRNPLGLIKSYTYIIEKHRINEICSHAVSVINNSINRINKLIENLLRFSRLSNDEAQLVVVKNFVESIINIEKEKAEQKGISISCIFGGEYERPILVNNEVLGMVLINLLNNSIDSFCDIEREDKKIHVKLSVEEGSLCVGIADNGCGIEKTELDNIFDPFYSTKENGTGLGLYIISTEISNNGGKITVESNPGEGTAFEIILPIME
jgi:PAS domain S-box-containing protein